MSFSSGDSLLVSGLLAAALLLIAISQFVRVPYPILLVLGGVGLAFVPHAPHVELSPDLVLVAVLPPLLYGGAFFTSLRELRASRRAIGLLAVGLVLLTMVAVAVVAHAVIPELGWAEAFVLGAIVSPTDPTASSAIAERLGLPTRLVALIEGESLVNDGTALVAYRFAVAAVVTGTFSLFDASWHFVLNVAGGIAVGLVVGYLIRRLRRRLDDPPVEIAIALLSGYLGYLPAPALRVSGGLPAGPGARRLGRARGRHGRDLHGLPHARADDRADATAGTGRLGDRLSAPERPPVRARRAAAADDPGRALGTLDRRADRLRGDRQRGRGRRADRLALRDLPARG